MKLLISLILLSVVSSIVGAAALEPAKPLFRPLPELSTVQKNLSGPVAVVVEFIVTPSGLTRDAFVTYSTNRSFEAAAVDAVRTWRYSPAVRDGKSVSTRKKVEFAFGHGGVKVTKEKEPNLK